MAVDLEQERLAFRTRLLTLQVCTTGPTSLAAEASGTLYEFVRTTGSFLTDGFRDGMEVTPSGFASSAVNVIKSVSALRMAVVSSIAPEAAAGSRSLTVSLPSNRQWENEEFTPPGGSPWVEEQMLPGPGPQIGVGPQGEIERNPSFKVFVHCVQDRGAGAPDRYATAIIQHFAPATAMVLTNGDTMRVRRGPAAPFAAPSIRLRDGFLTTPVTVPCRLFTNP